jgi:hypothetical protein
MEAVGALGFPVPRPQPLLQKPRPQPRVADGLLETILIEVTRPAPEAFSVRIFDEDFTPPPADVVSAFVFYGVPVATVARRLEEAWRVLNLRTVPGVRYAAYHSYDHARGHSAVIASIEALQESFLP